MNKKLLFTFAGITLLVIGVLIGVISRPEPAPVNDLGGTVSIGQRIFPDGLKAGINEREIFDSKGIATDLVFGGGILATTTGANGTTTAANICQYSRMNVTPTGAQNTNYNLTFPATSTLFSAGNGGCLLVNDSYKLIEFYNTTSSTSYSTTTLKTYGFVDGTEIKKMSTSSDAVSHTIEIGGEQSVLVLLRRISDATNTISVFNQFK